MRPILIAPTTAILLAGVLAANARPDTRLMTCAQVRSLIAQHGAIVLATGPTTFDRYVSAGGARCKVGQVAQRVSVPSRDGKCPVLRCAEYDFAP